MGDGSRQDNFGDDEDTLTGKEHLPARIDRGSTMGEILLREKLVNVTQLHEAQRVQQNGETLGYTLSPWT